MALGRSNPVSNTGRHRRAVGTFPNRHAAEQALHELNNSGFPMDRVSIVAQDSEQRTDIAGAEVRDRKDARHSGNKADDGAKTGAVSGGTIGGLTGLLVGIGALAIPGIGPIMLAGAAATALATTAAGGAIGAAAGSLIGGLVGMGIPEDRAKAYSDRVSAGEYLVMVDGSDDDIARAGAILHQRGIQEWGVFNVPEAGIAPTTGAETLRTNAALDAGGVASSPALDSDTVKLYEERLVVDKSREKTGEVSVGKHVEVETARASVPIEKERVVIERVTTAEGTAVVPGDVAFQDGETVRMDVYEETPDIRKEAFVREEIKVRKEVSQETVSAEETLRREDINIDTQGRPMVDADPSLLKNDRS